MEPRQPHIEHLHERSDAEEGVRSSPADTLMRLIRWILHPVTLLTWLVASVLAAMSGPFGTYNATMPWAFLSAWMILIGSVMVIIFTLFIVLSTSLGEQAGIKLNAWLIVLGSICSGYVLEWLLHEFLAPDAQSIPGMVELTLFVGLIMLVVAVVREFILTHFGSLAQKAKDTGDVETAGAAMPEKPQPRLMHRLPETQGRGLVRLSASGHYTDVVTEDGTHRLRLRFSDALLELEGVDGVVTHRSHWVAKDQIKGLQPDPVRPIVHLANGDQVPVSRSKRSVVEALGLDEIRSSLNDEPA